jgi:Tol biopolymer transport system component/predicted Ser/Thr protein kinase
MIGQSVSHYKILEKLGEGGMGVVYKAHDTKLDRLVALKFLPHGITVSEEDKARFLQEARAASAVMHPNVCVIYDIAEHEDQQFIVMEYVDGKTLRQIIPVQRMRDAITYAIQIGEALQEAHSKGVVHRDVKTDNIMVNTKNQIKVMDFGLAKLKGSLKLTRTSSTVGTLAYMAPEQIQGGEVDARSDIFSFGVVLYEMLTGHLPFHGEHEAAMMYSIVNEDPESVLRYRPDLSAELDRIIHRALEKDPEDRYQSAADMVSELRKVLKQTTKVVRTSVLQKEIPGAEGARELQERVAGKRVGMPKPVLLSVVGVAMVLVAVVLYFAVFRTRAVELNPNMRFQTLQISFSQISYPGLSADGNWIAFPAADANGKWDIYYMNATVGEPRRVTFDSSANPYGITADISPDGGMIAYDRYDAKKGRYDAYIVPSIGGRSKRIAEDCQGPKWRRDGGRIGYMAGTRKEFSIWSVKPDGSERRREILDTLTGTVDRIDFDWLPDGKSIVWLRSFPGGYQEIIRRDLEIGKETQLTYDKKNIDEVCWASNDQIIYSSNKSGNTNLWMIPASGGQSVQITKGSGPDMGMSISADGKKLLYLQSQTVGHLWMGGIAGHVTRQLTTDERNITWPSLSPDGKQIAFGMSDNDPLKSTSHIFVCDRDGNNRRQITSGDEFAEWPTWSPNGKWISYYARKGWQSSDSAMIYIVDQSDPGSPRPLGRGLYSKWIDTTTLEITNPSRGKGAIVTLDGRSKSIAYRDSINLWPILDGKNVLLIDMHMGQVGWYVAAAKNNQVIEGAKPRRILTRGYPPNLSPDRKFFYYSPELDLLWRISIPDGKDERIPGTFPGLFRLFSISSDGKEIVYNDSRLNSKLVIIENLFR